MGYFQDYKDGLTTPEPNEHDAMDTAGLDPDCPEDRALWRRCKACGKCSRCRPKPQIVTWSGESSGMGAAFRIVGGDLDGCRSTNRFNSQAAAKRAALLYLAGTGLDDIDGDGRLGRGRAYA